MMTVADSFDRAQEISRPDFDNGALSPEQFVEIFWRRQAGQESAVSSSATPFSRSPEEPPLEPIGSCRPR